MPSYIRLGIRLLYQMKASRNGEDPKEESRD